MFRVPVITYITRRSSETVTFVEDTEEKEHALRVMIRRIDLDYMSSKKADRVIISQRKTRRVSSSETRVWN